MKKLALVIGLLFPVAGFAQFSIDWFTIDGGGGSSTKYREPCAVKSVFKRIIKVVANPLGDISPRQRWRNEKNENRKKTYEHELPFSLNLSKH